MRASAAMTMGHHAAPRFAAAALPVTAGTRPRLLALALFALLIGCGGASRSPVAAPSRETLTLSAFSVVREAYDQAVLPAFARWYQRRTGRAVDLEASYGASGAQSRAVVEGFEADVVVFSMGDDVERLRKAGLVRHDPEAGPTHGLVSHSIVAFAVRPGNPKHIHDWADLTRDDVAVLTANPTTSGGAIWNIAALYGAAGREPTRSLARVADPAELLTRVLRRVEIMDRSGRDSVQTFERGMGDVVLTYENEIVVGQRAGRRYDQVTPHSTLRIDNPAAIVDVYADKHGRREVAEAFLSFLLSAESQRIFCRYGLRSVDPAITLEAPPPGDEAPAIASAVAKVEDLFTMNDLGGFPRLKNKLFSATGIYPRAIQQAQARR